MSRYQYSSLLFLTDMYSFRALRLLNNFCAMLRILKNDAIISTLESENVNKVLRNIVNAPWYVRNDDLHRDLKMEHVTQVTKRYAEAHEKRLHHHVNVEAIQLLDNTDLVRRLKRTKPFELV